MPRYPIPLWNLTSGLEQERVTEFQGFLDVEFENGAWNIALVLINGDRQVSAKFDLTVPAGEKPPGQGSYATFLTRDETTCAFMAHGIRLFIASFSCREVTALAGPKVVARLPESIGLGGEYLKGLLQ